MCGLEIMTRIWARPAAGRYFDSIGATTNSPLAGVGVVLSAFSPPAFNDLGNHHIKVEVNGSVVEFFVDGIYGGSAPFPYTNGISFGSVLTWIPPTV